MIQDGESMKEKGCFAFVCVFVFLRNRCYHLLEDLPGLWYSSSGLVPSNGGLIGIGETIQLARQTTGEDWQKVAGCIWFWSCYRQDVCVFGHVVSKLRMTACLC